MCYVCCVGLADVLFSTVAVCMGYNYSTVPKFKFFKTNSAAQLSRNLYTYFKTTTISANMGGNSYRVIKSILYI